MMLLDIQGYAVMVHARVRVMRLWFRPKVG